MVSDDVRKWLQVWGAGKKESTINLRLSVLTSFFNFCLEEDYLTYEIMKKRWRPKIPRALPKSLNSKELSRLRIAVDKMNIESRALFELFVSSGCRRFEVANLNVENIDFTNDSASVIGKGNKKRIVFFSKKCSMLLKKYLKTRTTGPVFLNYYGKRLSTKGIYLLIRKIKEMSQMDIRLTPHILRHTFATNQLSKGAKIRVIADFLGHTNIDTTRIYTKVNPKDLIAEYKKRMEYQ